MGFSMMVKSSRTFVSRTQTLCRKIKACAQVRLPPGTRRELGAQLRRSVNTAEVQLQVAASKAEDTQPAASASAAWDKLREISRTLEAGPSLT